MSSQNFIPSPLSWFQLGQSWLSSQCQVCWCVSALGEKQCWQYISAFIVALLFFTEPRTFQLLVLSCQCKGMRGHKELRGDRTRTSELNWPKGYFMTYDIIWKNLGSWLGRGVLLKGWLDVHQLVVNNCTVHTLLSWHILSFLLLFSFSVLVAFISTHEFYFVAFIFFPSQFSVMPLLPEFLPY